MKIVYASENNIPFNALTFEGAVDAFNKEFNELISELNHATKYYDCDFIPSSEGLLGDIARAGRKATGAGVRTTKSVLGKLISLIKKALDWLSANFKNLIDVMSKYDKKYENLPEGILTARKALRTYQDWEGKKYKFPKIDVDALTKSVFVLDINNFNNITIGNTPLKYLYEGLGKDLTDAGTNAQGIRKLTPGVKAIADAGSKGIIAEVCKKIGIPYAKDSKTFQNELMGANDKGDFETIDAEADEIVKLGEDFFKAMEKFGSSEQRKEIIKMLRSTKDSVDKINSNFSKISRQMDLQLKDLERKNKGELSEKKGEIDNERNEAQEKNNAKSAEFDKAKEELRKKLEESKISKDDYSKNMKNVDKEAKSFNKEADKNNKNIDSKSDQVQKAYEEMANALNDFSVVYSGASSAYTTAYSMVVQGTLNAYKEALNETYLFMSFIASL